MLGDAESSSRQIATVMVARGRGEARKCLLSLIDLRHTDICPRGVKVDDIGVELRVRNTFIFRAAVAILFAMPEAVGPPPVGRNQLAILVDSPVFALGSLRTRGREFDAYRFARAFIGTTADNQAIATWLPPIALAIHVRRTVGVVGTVVSNFRGAPG